MSEQQRAQQRQLGKLRVRRRIDLRRFALAVLLSPTRLRMYEHGIATCHPRIFSRICAALHVRVDSAGVIIEEEDHAEPNRKEGRE